MPVSPTGILSEALDAARTAISNSATFQTLVGAGSAAAALAKVYGAARSASGAEAYSRPFALVMIPEQTTLRIGRGAYGVGAIRVLFECNATAAYNHQDATYEFTNQLGAIINEVSTLLFGTSGYQLATEITIEMIQRANITETEDYFQAIVRWEYGLT